MIRRVDEFGAQPVRIVDKIYRLLQSKLEGGAHIAVTMKTADPIMTFTIELAKANYDNIRMMQSHWEELVGPENLQKGSMMLSNEPYKAAVAIANMPMQELEQRLDKALARGREA